MSTPGGYPPQGPQQPPNPQYPQGAGSPGATPDGGDGKRPNMKVYWASAIVLALVLSVGGYFFGRSQGEKQYDPGTAGYQRIYDAGYDAGRTGGKAAGEESGKKAGEASGKQAGLEEGTKQGQAQGTKQGAAAALGGFSSWDTDDTFYVVTVQPGQQDEVPFTIASRVPMTTGTYYSPCENDPSTLCTFPRPTPGDDVSDRDGGAGTNTSGNGGDDVDGRDGGAGD